MIVEAAGMDDEMDIDFDEEDWNVSYKEPISTN